MANAKQISVFVDNKPAQLAGVMELIKESGVNVRALSLADTSDFGILRMIVQDTDKAVSVLKSASYAVTVTEILVISIPDAPGQLSRVLDILGSHNVNLEYLYAFTGVFDNTACFAIRVDDNASAVKVLTDNGIITLTENDLA